jgi:hypothetical protein
VKIQFITVMGFPYQLLPPKSFQSLPTVPDNSGDAALLHFHAAGCAHPGNFFVITLLFAQ